MQNSTLGNQQAIGESGKATSVAHEEVRYYTIGHSKTRLDKLSEDLLGRDNDSPEGRALVLKKISGSNFYQATISIQLSKHGYQQDMEITSEENYRFTIYNLSAYLLCSFISSP